MRLGHRGGTTFEVGFLALLGKCKYCNVGGKNGRDRCSVQKQMSPALAIIVSTAIPAMYTASKRRRSILSEKMSVDRIVCPGERIGMKRYVMAIVLLAAFCILSGCGNDECPTCPEPPIAQFSFVFSGGTAEQIESLRCALGYETHTYADTIATVILQDGDMGIRRTFDAENSPNFVAFSEMMTNGIDDTMRLTAWRLPGGLPMSVGSSESVLFMGGLTGDMNPDLAGAQITKVMMTIRMVIISVPGHDPNGNGNWTDYNITIDYFVFGVI